MRSQDEVTRHAQGLVLTNSLPSCKRLGVEDPESGEGGGMETGVSEGWRWESGEGWRWGQVRVEGWRWGV